jgi:phosphoribosylanthranilate isomerase
LQACRQLGALPQAVLLDAFAPGSYGGTGQVLDWLAIASARPALLNLPIVLAGGLTPTNVAEAIFAAQPDAVDVASGVESAPGIKDAAKVYAFAAHAKKALAALDK